MKMRSEYSIYGIIVILFMTFSCCNEKDKSPDNRWDNLTFNLIAEPLFLDSTVYDSGKIIILGDHIILPQKYAGKEFSLFKLNGDSLNYKGSFLNLGRGPHEVNSAEIHYIPETNTLSIIGYNFMGCFISISLDNIDNLFNLRHWQVYDNPFIPYSAFSATPIDTESYIVKKFDNNSNNMFGIFNIKDTIIVDLNTPFPDDKDLLPTTKAMDVYNGHLLKNPKDMRFVFSSSYGHFVKIFSVGDNMAVLGELDLFKEIPKYQVSNGKRILDPHTKSGLKLSVSNNYIYCSDTKLSSAMHSKAFEINGYPAGYAKTIYVSDWEGNPVIKYITDRAVVFCAIDKSDEYLYAFAFNEETLEPDIVRFKLPDLKTDSK